MKNKTSTAKFDPARAKRSTAYRRAWAVIRPTPPRWYVYNEMPYRFIEVTTKPTTNTKRLGDLLFEQVRQATVFKNSKVDEKRRYLHHLLHAFQIAAYENGCVAFPRHRNHSEFKDIRCQVADAMIELGYLTEERSPRGAPKMSRLIPMPSLRSHFDIDPWTFDPPNQTQCVFVRDRGTEDELSFDTEHPVARDVALRLTQINEVNSQHSITYQPIDKWEFNYDRCHTVLRPFHYAIFTDGFDKHGRIYTGKYGHQQLDGLERHTIRFNGDPSCELDYSGMHPRMLYHLNGIAYDQDPYALWGEFTTPAQRLLAKKAVNTLINATTEKSALSSCNRAMRSFNDVFAAKTGKPITERKTGKALRNAQQLSKALKLTGSNFKKIIKRAKRHHKAIAHRFGSDAGMELMRWDSKIALDVMSHFAKDGIAVLGVHDSFVVAARHESELREAMLRCYHHHLGHYPIVK